VTFAAVDPHASHSADVARALTGARRAGAALPDFPAAIPATLAEAYEIQDAGLALWSDEVAGWKVGRVPDPLQATLGEERLSGPIFRRRVWDASSGEIAFPVFVGGFAAVEAEFVAVIGADAPDGQTEFSDVEAAALIGAVRIGVETAGSPLPAINDLGPTVVASDFGNNAGLILGGEIADWTDRLYDIGIEAFVDGELVGRGGASSLPGGPVASVRFAAEHCARRGRPLKAGQLISTGAITGIHEVTAGQAARMVFAGVGAIACRAVAAVAE